MLTATRGSGAERLEIEAAYDRTVRTYIEDKGTPDYIFVENRNKVSLVYIDRDEVAVFSRSFSAASQVVIQKPIPDTVLADIAERPTTVSRWAHKRLTKADELLGEDKYAEALEELDRMKGERSLNDYALAVMWQMYGLSYSGQEKYAEAAESFEKCLEMNALDQSKTLRVQYTLGQVYLAAERFDEALNTLVDWYGKSEAPSADNEYTLASAYFQTNRHAEAIPYVERAIAGSSLPKESWYQLLQDLHFELKHYQEARDTLELLLIQFPKEEYWGQLTRVVVLLDQWDDLVNLVNEEHTDLDTVLRTAATTGRPKIVEHAAAQGADVNAGGPSQWTALQLAARSGHEETVRVLLDLGANPYATDASGRTAAQLASESGHQAVARLLLHATRRD